ncbi:metallo-beta-lactamase superfamily [Diplonema papillatum]|nr:metallo-beta-lactamase superfamily [Diplonema papillatum]
MRRTGLRLRPFRLVGPPLRSHGAGDAVSSEQLVIRPAAGSAARPLTIHAVSGYVQITYLVQHPGERKAALLDSASVFDVPPIQLYLRERLPGVNLATAVVTHSHPDHMGGSVLFREEEHAVVVGPKGLCEWYGGAGVGWVQWKIDCLAMGFAARKVGRRLRNVFKTPRAVAVDAELRHGEPVPGLEDWTAVSVPGHTSHMMALWHRDARVFYAADMMLLLKGQFCSPMPVNSEADYFASLDRIAGLPVKYLLLAHGGILHVRDHGGWPAIVEATRLHCLHRSSSRSPRWGLRFVTKLLNINTPRVPLHTHVPPLGRHVTEPSANAVIVSHINKPDASHA